MRKTIVIVPEWVSGPESDSVLRQNLHSLSRMAEKGVLFRLSPTPRLETPEALYLGLRPDEAQMRPGPLMVSALGADPPDRSTHFQLSLLSLKNGVLSNVVDGPTDAEADAIASVIPKLNTKLLTILRGDKTEHGLVWEQWGDMRTFSSTDVFGQSVKDVLPQGDPEVLLRRFIDDSVNMLSDLEFNRRREDEERQLLNLLWPWGDGVRKRVTNLALRRGEPAFVESNSIRMQGLVRLAGYRHGQRALFGEGTATALESIAQSALNRPTTIILLDAMQVLRREGKWEELEWMSRRIDENLLRPLLDNVHDEPAQLTVVAPGKGPGLAVMIAHGMSFDNSNPFDERALEDRRIPERAVYQTVAQALE